MSLLLLVGACFWFGMTFVGVQRGYVQNRETAFFAWARSVHAGNPQLLRIAGIVLPLTSVGLIVVEIVRISRFAGTIGGFASLGLLLSIAGGLSLGLAVAIDAEGQVTAAAPARRAGNPPRTR